MRQVFAIAALGAMLFSPITAQAQSDIVGAWKVREFYVDVVVILKYERME
jgi:hypothetical protein